MADDRARHVGNQFRLDKIRSIKQSAFILQWIAFVLLAVLIVFLDGLSFNPFYVPLGGAIYYFCIIILVMICEGIAFTLLEIRYEVSDSERYLKSRSASNKALVYTIIAVILAILTITPPITGLVESGSTNEGTLADQSDVRVPTVLSVGLRELEEITVTVSSGSAQVFIVDAEKFDRFGMDYDVLRLSSISTQYNITSNSPIELTHLEMARGELVIVVYSVIDGTVRYSCEYKLISSFHIMIPIFTLIIAIVNIVWFVMLIPMKKKYRELSIYA